MRSKIAFSVLFCFFVVVPAGRASDAGKEKTAASSGEKWLGLIDQGRYGESWTEAAAFFKSSVAKAQWEKMVQSVRSPLGKLLTRKLIKATYATTLPGAPDGEYVIVQFETSFENKKSATETVTPMLDKDGQWRVSGYFIK